MQKTALFTYSPNPCPQKVTVSNCEHPFGMLMPGRTYSSEAYSWGFNGQEKDDEIFKGANGAEYWEYDSRTGRRWNTDPIIKPWESPYAVLRNSPIQVIDPKGDDGYVDKDGNNLGDDGNKDSHEVRVISSDKWKSITGEKNAISADMRTQLINASTKLENYSEGINITDKTWESLEKNGSTKIQPWLKNDSKYSVYVRRENDDDKEEPKKINSGDQFYGEIDGIAAPHLRKKEVFKAADGIRVTVNNNTLDWESTGVISLGSQIYKGGWKGESWLINISANKIKIVESHAQGWKPTKVRYKYQHPDYNWILLFKKSGLTNAEDNRNPHTTEKHISTY